MKLTKEVKGRAMFRSSLGTKRTAVADDLIASAAKSTSKQSESEAFISALGSEEEAIMIRKGNEKSSSL